MARLGAPGRGVRAHRWRRGRDRGQGTPRPDARPSGVHRRHPVPVPARAASPSWSRSWPRKACGGQTGVSAAFASAQIGQVVFAAMLMLMTLQVVFLAPSSTSGAISLEREKQTLDLLITTPISSLAIIVGKLLSALVWVFLLIAASIPMLAVVFVFGGVGPESVVPGYLVLVAVALGLGSFGLLCSSVVKRTTAATAADRVRRPGRVDRDRVRPHLLERAQRVRRATATGSGTSGSARR